MTRIPQHLEPEPHESFNGVLPRLWGGGGGGAPCHDDNFGYYNHSGGDGGSGAGGGGGAGATTGWNGGQQSRRIPLGLDERVPHQGQRLEHQQASASTDKLVTAAHLVAAADLRYRQQVLAALAAVAVVAVATTQVAAITAPALAALATFYRMVINMSKYARIENGEVMEIITFNPAGKFAPNFVLSNATTPSGSATPTTQQLASSRSS